MAYFNSRRLHSQLPIYAIEKAQESFLYVPGAILCPADPRAVQRLGRRFDKSGSAEPATREEDRLARRLISLSAGLRRERERMAEADFQPAGLTVLLTDRCNADCSYCFTRDMRHGARTLSPGIVKPLARLVLESCRETGRKFVLAFQGAGEPTQAWEELWSVHAECRRLAESYEIPFFSYVSTNGQISRSAAARLAGSMDRIGLSCDGPPEIQDLQRPARSGKSSQHLQETVRTIRESGGDLEARTTITRFTLERMPQIAEYLAGELRISRIRFEPLFGALTDSELALRFAEGLRSARRSAQRFGARLEYSGCRPGEIHGPHCDLLKDVIRLTPEGMISSCFYRYAARSREIGRVESHALQMLSAAAIAQFKKRALTSSDRCFHCFCDYHCSRGCPETCTLSKQEPDDSHCRMQRQITFEWLLDKADTGRNECNPPMTTEALYEQEKPGLAAQ